LRLARRDAHGERLRRAAPDRAFERLADDLVERGLRPLAEHFRCGDVQLGLDAVLQAAVLRERLHGHREAVVAEDDRLEIEREVAELADRGSRARQRLVEGLLGLGLAAAPAEILPRVGRERY